MARRNHGAAVALCALLLAACDDAQPPAHLRVADGAADRGRQLAAEHGCGACHVIPGVAGAVSFAGPPLSEWARRGWLAGRFPNTPEQLVRWLADPQAMSPGSAMPTLGLSEREARDIAAYLMTLGAERVEPVPAGMRLGPDEGGPRPEPRKRERDG